MSDVPSATADCPRLSASELRNRPLEEQNAILEAQAKLAEQVYRDDPELTDFEAFGEDDLHGDSSSAEAR
jgi:hypothetical protein